MTVFDNVAYGLKLRKVPQTEIKTRVEEMLEMVGLGGYGDRAPSKLSGGQQQRVALARSLIVTPSVLLLDEPLSNLDALLREQMRVEIRRIQKKLGITAIYVTHGHHSSDAQVSSGKQNQAGHTECIEHSGGGLFKNGQDVRQR